MVDIGGLPPLAPLDANMATMAPTDDGGAIIDFDPQPLTPDVPAFNANLALMLDDRALQKLGNEIVEVTNEDDRSREPWKRTYARGLELLGLEYEKRTEPWAGACGAFHPLLLESIIRFNAQAMMDIFPPAGPIKTKVVGRTTDDKERHSKRVRDDLNWIATEKMKDYRADTDMMLFNLPLAGSTFRKFRFDRRCQYPAADYLLSEHVVMPYSATSLATAPRFALILEKTRNWVEAQQKSGFYRDVVLSEAEVPKNDQITKSKDKITGQTNTSTAASGLLRLYESYIDYSIEEDPYNTEGLPLPYIITVDAATSKVLGIYRNWREDDAGKERVTHVVQHKYMPGFGPYGLGLVNVLGGLTESATSILRQLVDAGTLSNLPAGYKTKDARVKGDATPIGPGEWRDVDVGSGTLKESFFPLPYGEPSTVLAALLGQIVDEGRRLGSVADMKITDMTGQNMPVGTTLAIIERSMKVMSAVQQRLYESFRQEYRVLAEIVGDFMGDMPYAFELDPRDQQVTRREDYGARVDIIPVADPNASTMAQKIMSLQAVIQLSQTAPQIYDLKATHRQFITILTNGEDADRFIPPDEDVMPLDPVTENMRLLTNKPVRAGIAQDHEAHITVHMAAVKDPKMGGLMAENPMAPAIMAAAVAHLQEHLAFQYRKEIEDHLGSPLPPPSEPLPEDVEYDLSRLIAAAASKMLEKNIAEQREKEILDAMQDPVVQNEMRALDIKQQTADDKRAKDEAEINQRVEDRLVDVRKTLFKEIAETERSTLASQVNAKTEASKVQLKQAETASNLTGQLLTTATKMLDTRVKRDIASKKPAK